MWTRGRAGRSSGPRRPDVRPVSLAGLAAYARALLAEADAFAPAEADRQTLVLPGLTIDLTAGRDALAQLCRAHLVAPPAETIPAARARVLAFDATMPGWPAPAPWDTEAGFSARAFDAVLVAEGLRGFYHHDAPSWQIFDPATGRGVYSLPEPLAVPPWERGAPLRLFMHWAYAASGRRFAHAATLGLDGRGVLLVGGSGSGKSGTTLSGVLHGLTSVGDDYVMLERNGPIVARALFRTFKQDAPGLDRVGLRPENLPSAELNWAGKYEFDAAALVPGGLVDTLAIDAIVIPEITGGLTTEIVPTSSHMAALRLAPSAVFQLPGDREGGFHFFSELARSLPAYRARVGRDPADVAAAFRRLFAELPRHVD